MTNLKEEILNILETAEGEMSTTAVKNELLPDYKNYNKILNALEELYDEGKVSVEEVEKGERIFRNWKY